MDYFEWRGSRGGMLWLFSTVVSAAEKLLRSVGECVSKNVGGYGDG